MLSINKQFRNFEKTNKIHKKKRNKKFNLYLLIFITQRPIYLLEGLHFFFISFSTSIVPRNGYSLVGILGISRVNLGFLKLVYSSPFYSLVRSFLNQSVSAIASIRAFFLFNTPEAGPVKSFFFLVCFLFPPF